MLDWKPGSTAQKDALDSDAQLLLMGGSAGSLKSEFLLIDAVQEFKKPGLRGVIFRTSFPELEQLIRRSHLLYTERGGTFNGQTHTWHWPSGATIRFSYLMNDNDPFQHQGMEYSFIGFDESTHRSEFQIRYLLSRLRSTDPSLDVRCRMATNPGGPGHKLHSHIFLGGVCPHCQPAVRKPGIIYNDATWLSDKKPIEMTTQFIFGRLSDHNLLPDYDKQVRMQSGSTAKALLEGCWRAFEGQYYDIWEPNREGKPMVVKRQTVGDDWYLAHWTGTDYGFSGSTAASVLMCRTLDGRIYCLQEYVNRREDVRSFAKSFYERFAKKQAGDEGELQGKRIEANFLGPDAWNDRGDHHTLADQMNEVLEPHGLNFSHAKNDRAGGAQLIYTMLQTGELVICDTCPLVIEALESRIHDPKEPEKVFKVLGDELDDVFDALRYALYSYQETQRKPAEMRVRERMEKMLREGGRSDMALTTAILNYQKIERQEQDEEQPTYLGGSARRRMQRR